MSEGRETTSDRSADEALATITSGLGRLFALAAIYPPGHPRINELLTQVALACQQCDRGQGVTLEVTQHGLSTPGGDPLPLDPNLARLHGVLHSLAITALHVAANVSVIDLQQFVTTLFGHKSHMARALGYSQIDLREQLPASIQVVHRSFGSRIVSEPVAVSLSGRASESVMRRLPSAVPQGDLGAVTQLVGSVVSRIVERVEHGAPGDPAAKGRALDAVLDLCAHAMKHAIEQMFGDGHSLSDLGQLVQNVEKAVAVAQDKQSVEVMLDVLQLAADEVEQRQREDDAGNQSPCELTLDQLQAQLAGLAGDQRPFVQPAAEHQERLTILMQLSLLVPPPQLSRIGAALRSRGTAPWGPDELAIVVRGIADFAAHRDAAVVDRLLPTVFEAVRAGLVDGLRDFLLPLSTSLSKPTALVHIWPHVVNELLHLSCRATSDEPPSGDILDAIWRRLGAIGETDCEQAIKRLVRLDFVRRDRTPDQVMDTSHPELRRVLIRILNWPEAEVLGRHLFQALRHGPPRWIGFESALALSQYDASARGLLQEVLRAGDRTAESLELQQLSLQILASVLPVMPSERRHEAWVPDALIALGEIPGADAERVLATVLRRRWLIWSQWPARCRRMARTALAQGRSPRAQGSGR